MATIHFFEDLDIWQEARRLSKKIIQYSKTTDLKTNYKLKDQINASAGSVMDNIAEGFERSGNLEFRQFLAIAKGSAVETRSQCYRLLDWEYISEDESREIIEEYKTLSKRIAGFMNYLTNSDIKGIKFKGKDQKP